MGLARDLVELEARLRDRDDVDLFAAVERSGLLEMPESASMLGRIRSTDPASVMRLCLQALRIQHEELRPKLGRPEREDLTLKLWIEIIEETRQRRQG